MPHPFEVGEQYRNRKGEYEVLELNGPQMIIEYSDGEILETTVNLQARIWRNILIDEKAKRERKERKARARRRRRRKRRRGREAGGVEDGDFKLGVTGTSWRRREKFGGLLAQTMTDGTADFFQSYAIYRTPEVHVAQPDHYKRKIRRKAAKFFFRLDEEKATFGICIEKPSRSANAGSHWKNGVDGLLEVKDELSQAMEKHELHWELTRGNDHPVARVEEADGALRWKGEETTEEIAWADFQERVATVEKKKPFKLSLCGTIEKEEAIDAGLKLANQAVAVYRALLPLYRISTGDAEQSEQ